MLRKLLLTLAAGATAVAGGGWLGLQVKPKTDAPAFNRSRDLGTIDLPPNLPAPVERFYRATVGDKAPRVETLTAWGTARMKRGTWMPLRFHVSHVPGYHFRRFMTITWFGFPLMTAIDEYLNGRGATIVGDEKATGEKMDQGANLILWAEAIWMPSLLISDPRLRWEAVDDHTARLIAPDHKSEGEALTYRFDPQTGLLSQIWAMRYKGQDGDLTPWWVDVSNWKGFNGVLLPSRFAIVWGDEGTPWSIWDAEMVEWNVDVSADLPEVAPKLP